MKKIFFSLITILIVVIIIIALKIGENVNNAGNVSSFNKEIEAIYKDKTIYGADVMTIINKAIDNNNTYNVEKNEEGQYVSDDKYSLKVELILLTKSDDGEVKEATYPMETLEKARA